MGAGARRKKKNNNNKDEHTRIKQQSYTKPKIVYARTRNANNTLQTVWQTKNRIVDVKRNNDTKQEENK